MKYMVMECNLSYAVVLSEDGQFKKVANLHYEIGQTVTEIFLMNEEEKVQPVGNKQKRRVITGILTMAACLIFAITSLLHVQRIPYGSVYMRINPEVRIDVNYKDVVIGLTGLNADGEGLIDGYSYNKKELTFVMDELVDLAIDAGYLSKGEKITLTIDAKDKNWVTKESESLNQHLNEYLEDKISVTIQIEQPDNSTKVTIPVTAPVKTTDKISDSVYSDSEYGDVDSGYEEADSDYKDVDSGYEEADSEYEDADSGYEEADSEYEDAESVYDEPQQEEESDYEHEISDYAEESYYEEDDNDNDDSSSGYSDNSSDYD